MTFQYISSFVTLAVVDLEKVVCFYTQFLDIQPQTYIPNVYAEFQVSGLKLGIFKPKQTQEAEFCNLGNSASSLCLEVNDLESAIAYLTFIGYPPSGKILTATHGKEIYTYDPAGNRIILYESIK